ncbi:MAG: hypothetical protein KAS32_11655, partial [Candidatus Peribacteraceae bacterium]|nr:hypothetical protein [Candidatus Peribacteraceae bacterium]
DANATVTITGSSYIHCDLVEFSSGHDVSTSVFNDCLQITPSTATFDFNTISNYSGSEGGALYWPGGTSVSDSSFLDNTDAIEVTQTSNQDYDALLFSGNDYDSHLNNGGVDIDISKSNGSDPTSQRSTGGGTITYVGAAVSIFVKAVTTLAANIVGARVLIEASNGTGPFPYQETVTIVNSGTTATVTHATHGIATNDYVKIVGASLTANNGVFQITVTGAGTYTYTMGSTPGSSPTGTITSTFVALFGITNGSGELSTTRVYPSTQPVVGVVRKSTGTPLYKTSGLVGGVTSTDGYSATAVLVADE